MREHYETETQGTSHLKVELLIQMTIFFGKNWWARQDLNLRHLRYERRVLTN